MKGAHLPRLGTGYLETLYPTWFRWKFPIVEGAAHVLPSFISHMVQMKELFLCGIFHAHHYFISHMVQMKVAVLKFINSYETLTLYPTWFRWKSRIKLKNSCPSITFISHMVQMKASTVPTDSLSVPSLYPTWFRWKTRVTIFDRSSSSTLYPTWFRWKSSLNLSLSMRLASFISHMVQMKEYYLFR